MARERAYSEAGHDGADVAMGASARAIPGGVGSEGVASEAQPVRKLSRKERKLYGGEAHCLWCGALTESPYYVVNPGGEPVLKCCCQEHLDLIQLFIERDTRYKRPFWIALFICCLGSLLSLGFEPEGPIAYVPLLGFAIIVMVWPSLFTRYEFYARLGLVTTRRVFRFFAVLVGLLAISSSLSAWLPVL